MGQGDRGHGHWIRRLRHRARTVLQRQDLRTAVQTAGAVLLAYLVTTLFGFPEVTWAVFSALFVVQASIGGTISSGLNRIAGAILGAVVAVGLVMVSGESEWHTGMELFSGVALMTLLAARWPSLSYGLVTVTIITVAPDIYLVSDALEKVLAIAVGSACGIVAALVVFPVSAHRSLELHLSRVLRDCGRFMVQRMQELVGEEKRRDAGIGRSIDRSLDLARSMSQQARSEKVPILQPAVFSHSLLVNVEQLWHTMTLVDRFSAGAVSPEFSEQCRPCLVSLAEAVQSQMDEVASAVVRCEPVDGMDDLWAHYDRFDREVEGWIGDQGWDRVERERVTAIKWSYHSVLGNLDQVVDEVNKAMGHDAHAGSRQAESGAGT